MQMGLLAEAVGGGSSGLSPGTIFLILGVLIVIFIAFVSFLQIKKQKEKKNEVESKEKFQNTLSEIEKNTDFSNLFQRITNIRGIGLMALIVGLGSCAVFLFAPIFQIKIELFGETLGAKGFSLWDEILRFYKSSQSQELNGIQLVLSVISFLFILPIAILFLIALLITAFVLAWQYLAADKKKTINTLAHFMCDGEETQKSLVFNSSTLGVGLMIASNVFFIVHILLMKYLFKDDVSENFLFQEPPTYFPFVNSVSWIWCILAVILFVASVGMCLYADKREKELAKDIQTFLVSISAENKNPPENV